MNFWGVAEEGREGGGGGGDVVDIAAELHRFAFAIILKLRRESTELCFI